MNFNLSAPFSELAGKLIPSLPGNDGAHDISHLSRVWRNVKDIQRHEGGDLEILAAAALFDVLPKISTIRNWSSLVL